MVGGGRFERGGLTLSWAEVLALPKDGHGGRSGVARLHGWVRPKCATDGLPAAVNAALGLNSIGFCEAANADLERGDLVIAHPKAGTRFSERQCVNIRLRDVDYLTGAWHLGAWTLPVVLKILGQPAVAIAGSPMAKLPFIYRCFW